MKQHRLTLLKYDIAVSPRWRLYPAVKMQMLECFDEVATLPVSCCPVKRWYFVGDGSPAEYFPDQAARRARTLERKHNPLSARTLTADSSVRTHTGHDGCSI